MTYHLILLGFSFSGRFVRYNSILRHLEFLNIFKYGLFSYKFFCHKLLLWLVPFFLVALFIMNVILSKLSIIFLILLLSRFFYGIGILGWVKRWLHGVLVNVYKSRVMRAFCYSR
jgi:ABC-type uncharacterized transport system permease subunit